MNFNIDIAIFIGFLVINLVVGLRYGKSVKNIKDYALGGRNFSTAALVSTIVATFVTGSMFFVDLQNTYSDGLYYFIPGFCVVFQMLITVYFLIPRMGEFLGSSSVAEVMGDMYGDAVRFITAICGILSMVGYIAVQFKVFGNIFNYFLGIDPTYAIFAASTIVILYSSFGGIKAVTYTDIVQFITFGFVVPLIGIILWNYIYDSNLSFTTLTKDSNFDYTKVLDFNNTKFWAMFPLIFYFTVPSTDPTNFQRISMGRNIAQAKKAWLISAILFGLIAIAIAWIPLLIKIIHPNLEGNQLVAYLIDNYAYTGLKGLIIIGVFAMAMSSADSCINASSVLFANDIGMVLKIKMDKLTLSKWFSLILGVFGIYLALAKSNLLSIVMTTASFYLSIVTVPLLLAIFGFRSTKIPVLIGMSVGFCVILAGNFINFEADSIILGMFANLVFFISSHYLLKQPGGWGRIKDNRYLTEVRKERKRKIAAFLTSAKNFNLIEFCKKNAPSNELTYMSVGIYFILYTITTMYATNVELLRDGNKIILSIYQLMMITGVLLAMYPIWPSRLKREVVMQVAWNIVIFYMLIFFSCFFVMVSNFGQLQFAVFTLNIVMTALLVGWKLGLTMTVAGFYLSSQFYKFYTGVDNLDLSIGSPQFILMYSLMLIGSTLIIFLKPKQEHQILTQEKNEHLSNRIELQEAQVKEAWNLREEFIRNISHEYHAPMTGISSMAESLKHAYYKLGDKERLDAIDVILKSSVRLEAFDSNISSLAALSKAGFKLKSESINLTNLVLERIEICRKLYEEKKGDREFELQIEEDVIIQGDRFYLSQTLDNLIINAITYCPKGKIIIYLNKYKNRIEFSISDNGVGIPKDELQDIFGAFFVSSKTKTLAGGRGLGLTLCKRVLELHNGRISANSNEQKETTISFVLPHSVK